MKGCQILKISPNASIQDLGRTGTVEFGIPESGPMDLLAFQTANHLLGNGENAAVLEMALGGAEFLFEKPTHMVLTGAMCDLLINSEKKHGAKVHSIKAGDQVKITAPSLGQYYYLGIKGGFRTDKLLGSRSWFAGITSSKALTKGDTLPYRAHHKSIMDLHAHLSAHPAYLEHELLEVYPGPESKGIDPGIWDDLISKDFTISKKQNRMGIQLEESVDLELPEILSAPCYPGTVQLTPSGKLIVLMRDAQVTGGYPRLLQLTAKSISILSQKRAGDRIRFQLFEEKEPLPL